MSDDQEQVLNATVKFGVDRGSLGEVAKGGDDLKQQVNGISQNVEKMSYGFNKASVAARGLMGLARGGSMIGKLIGNQDLVNVSAMIQKVGGLTMQFSRLKASLDRMPQGVKAGLGIGVAGFAGFEIGKGIYDATIGKLQGTNSTEILERIGKLIEAGFSVDTLRVQAENAFIATQNQDAFKKFQDQLAGKGDTTLDKIGFYSGPRDLAGMQKALAQTEDYIKTAPDYKPPAEGEADQLNYKMIAQVIAKGLREQIAIEMKKATDTKTMESMRTGLQNSLTLQNRLSAASQQYHADELAIKKQLATVERDVANQRLAAAKSLAASLAEMETQYYDNRAKVAASFGEQELRAEQEHQKSMQRLREDHDKRMSRLADSRDALGLLDEMDAYETERKRAEDDYSDAQGQRNKDYQLQLREMEDNFRAQRQARITEYNQQLIDIAAYWREQKNIIAEQMKTIAKAVMDAFVQANKDYQATLPSNQTTSPMYDSTGNPILGHKALGGSVVAHGAYIVGERGPETLVMGDVGGRVIPNAAMAGGGFSPTVNLAIGPVSGDANQIAEVARTAVYQALVDVANEVNKG